MSERGEATVLIGFMGTGKSSIGRELARQTKLPRYDTDEMISARFGLEVSEIFIRFGEDEFRAAERDALAQIPVQPAIVATGGGIVLRAENLEILRRLGIIVNLTTAEETLFERAFCGAIRPLLQTENPRATLSKMLRLRQPLYRQIADFEVDTSTLQSEKICELILKQVRELRCAEK